MRGRIEAALTGWNLRYTDEQLRLLDSYRELLGEWNRKVGLVARGEDLTDHILDCLRGLPLLESLPGFLIADAGSGGGLPGIPLAIFQPRRRFVLVERSTKKAGFLRYAPAAVGLDNVEVAAGGLEELDPRFDGVVFRALGELKRYLPLLMDLVVPGGWLFGYKGRSAVATAELEELDSRGITAEIVPAPSLDDSPASPSGADAREFPGEARKERSFLVARKD